MKVQMGKGAVPIVVTYRKIIERPKVKRTRNFVGPRRLFQNFLLKAIEMVEDLAFETKIEPESPGKSVAVHWAISIEDPWDIAEGRESSLVAYRHAGDLPPCGAHFEILEPPESATDNDGNEVFRIDLPADPPIIHHPASEPPAHSRTTQPYVTPAYAPRQVKTLEEEQRESEDGNPEDLDRPYQIGEND